MFTSTLKIELKHYTNIQITTNSRSEKTPANGEYSAHEKETTTCHCESEKDVNTFEQKCAFDSCQF